MNSQEVRSEVAARSETGYVRDENQDRMSGIQTPLGQIYIVADGMGGHKGGAVAAELTVQGLQQQLGAASANAPVNEALREAFKITNETVYQKAHSGDPATEGMGSTAVLLLIAGPAAWIAHVGDSRAYLYRNGELRQLTTDHTLVQKMVQAGMLKAEEAMDHPDASVLERAMGNKPGVEVDVSDKLALNEGDAILLCSDGLSGYVVDAEIETVLRSPMTVQEVPEHLVNLALQKGGEDNVTVQFIQYGTRKEAQPRRAKELETLASLRPQPVRRPLWPMAAALVLGMAIVAVAAYEYWSREKVDPRIERLEQQLAAAEIAKTKAENDAKKLQGELEVAKTERTKVEDDVKNFQGEVKTAEAAKKKAESDVKKLQGEVKAVEVAKAKVEDDVKKLQGEVKAVEAAKAKVEDDVKKLQGELAAAAQELRKLKEEPKKAEEQKVSGPVDWGETTQSGTPEESGNTAPSPKTDSTQP